MNADTPSGPPGGPLQPSSRPPAERGPSRRMRSVLTHTAVALVAVVVGGLIGTAVAGDSGDGSGGGAAPSAEATVTATETVTEATSGTTAPGTAEAPRKASASEIPGDGTFTVGTDVRPGTYRSDGPQGGDISYCEWVRLSGFSGEAGDIIAANGGKGPTTVTIKATDKAFTSTGCKTWHKIG